MILQTLNIRNFRNYDSLSLTLDPHVNIIYGENGQGKSNLLESIYVLGLTKSHRTALEGSLIQEKKTSAKIKGTILKEEIPKKLEIVLSENGKKYKVDENHIKKVSDYISNFNVIIFYPEDLDIIKGSPSGRRKFINTELSGLQSIYYTVLTDYNKLLKMRNEYLKEYSFDNYYFEILTNYFMEKALLLYKMRQKFVERINEYAALIYTQIMPGKTFKVFYKMEDILNTEDVSMDGIRECYEKVREDERIYKKTLFGPHRDDFEFYLDDQNMNAYASQGQQRTAILAFKLAEIELYKKYISDTPILLLDDVFSELDPTKRENLIHYISGHIQTIITTTDLGNIKEDLLKEAKLIQIQNGKVIKQEEVK